MIVKVVFGFLLIIPICALSQSSQDSLQKLWLNTKLADSARFNAISEQYKINKSNLDFNLELTDYHLRLARKKGSIPERLNALHEKTKIQFFQGDLTSAKKTLKEELSLAKETNQPKDILRAHLLTGSIAVDERDFLNAIRAFNTGAKLAKENGLENYELTCLNNLAVVYQSIGNYDLSLQYLDEAEKRSKEINFKDNLGLIWLNQGTAKHSKEEYLEAIQHFEKAFDFFKKENNKFHESSCYYMLASCYHKLNLDDKASLYLEKSLEIDDEVDNELRTLEGLTLKGSIVFKNDVQEALNLGLGVLGKINDETPQDIKKGVFELLYKCYRKMGNYEKSLKMHELFMASSDSMRIEETNFATVREAVKYEFEIELYETQLKNQEEQAALKLSQVKKNYWIISVSVVVILSLLLFFRSKTIRMRKKREELLREIEELKSAKSPNLMVDTQAFALNREKVEESIDRKLNETDWKVLQILLDDPMITNKEIASKAFLSEDGIGSSLRRMYEYFDVKETKYKKIALLMNAIKRSKKQ